jgi:TPR repeat protein
MLADPFDDQVESGIDIVAMAKLFEDMGDLESAARLYLRGLEYDLPRSTLLEALCRLAALHKRQDNYPTAVELWEQAANHAHLEAHIELAKFFEHRARDRKQALYWTQTAIELVQSASLSSYERRKHLADLDHRKARLMRGISSPSQDEPFEQA